MKKVACERVFAWCPVPLNEGGWAWLQRVYRCYECEEYTFSMNWDYYYTRILPKDAL